jgi:type IV pilus assembly protein PilB
MIRIAVSRPADIMTSFKSGLQDLFAKRKLEVELFITGETDFIEAVKQYRESGNPLLLKKGSLPVVYLRNQPIQDNYLHKFPSEFVEKYRLVVFGQNRRGQYLIACEEPDSPITIKILDFIKKENKVNIEQFATSRDDIDYIIRRIIGKAEPKPEAVPSDPRPADKQNSSSSSQRDLSNHPPKPLGESKSLIKGLINSLFESAKPDLTIDGIEEDNQSDSVLPTQGLLDNASPSMKTDKIGPEQDNKESKETAKPEDKSESNVAKPTESSDQGTEQAKSDFLPPKDLETVDNNLGSLIKEDVVDEKMLENIVKEGSIPKIVAAVINYSLLKKASDIHVVPENKSLRVRCRIDGTLCDVVRLPLKDHPPLVSRIKIMSKLKIDESRIPQDGRFDVSFKEHEVDVRVSTLPTVHGEKVVMRILDKSQGILSLEDLGMQGSAFDETNLSINKPYGIILSTGPTGSGKSTTLYAILNRISVPGVNIVTLEDPVEYEIAGINQCQIKPEIGFTFASGLRSILRQDPNVIMVGEIRDAETAGMATHAALTGHLVLSTLHTNDTAGALPRLINMGVEPFLITSAINLVIAQRLVRRICPKCKEEVRVPQKLLDELKAEIEKIPANNSKDRARVPSEVKLYHGKGCSECNQGFRGRVGIYEVMTITPAIEELAIAKRPANEIKETAIKEGMITMKQDGILKAFAGQTTVDEVFQAVINS